MGSLQLFSVYAKGEMCFMNFCVQLLYIITSQNVILIKFNIIYNTKG